MILVLSTQALGMLISGMKEGLGMTELSDHNYALVHHKRPTWQAKLADSKSFVGWVVLFVLLGAVGGAVGGFLGPVIGYNIGWAFVFPFCFLTGLAIGLSVLFTVRFVDRRFFGAVKAGITALEDRLIEGSSQSPREDLEKLVAGSLKLKRLAAADVYSRQLLAISISGSDVATKNLDWVVASEAWASTEKYHRGWKYKLVWLYQTRGVLTLSPEGLDFQSKEFTFQCHPSMITKIEVKRHPPWMKPIPLRFISMTIQEFGYEHTFNITPSFGQTDTVWDCNRMVATWVQRLEKARSSVQIQLKSNSFPIEHSSETS
jgi:hypothetical protein